MELNGTSTEETASGKDGDITFSDDDDDHQKLSKSNSLPKVDRHGFVVTHQLHSKVASLPNPEVTGYIGKRREWKWLEMINKWDDVILNKRAKVKERCQKGIPQSVRSLAWQCLSGAAKLKAAKPNQYEETLSKSDGREWDDIIQKDIPRTFRHHCMFYENKSQGQEALRNVLLAYSMYDQSVGYNQALAPIAAVLLMRMQEDETFWMLVTICKNYLPGYYGEKMEALRLDGYIFDALLKVIYPDISKHMNDLNIDPLMYIVEWMACIYARCLPFQTVLRIWDMFFCEGVKVLFKIGLALLRLVFPTTKDMKDKDDFATTQLLNNLPKECTLETTLIPEALKVNISDKQFEKVHRKILSEHPELSFERFNGKFGKLQHVGSMDN